MPKEGQSYSAAAHREAFEGFLAFLKANLAGQTAIRVDASWATQSVTLSSFGDFVLPDRVIREDEMEESLADLARRAGHAAPPMPKPSGEQGEVGLGDIYDAALEELVADVYQRDYLMFGFAAWQ